MQAHHPATVAHSDDTTSSAARNGLLGLDIEHERAVAAGSHVEDVDTLDTKEFIGPGTPARTGPTRTVSHVRVFSCQLLSRC